MFVFVGVWVGVGAAVILYVQCNLLCNYPGYLVHNPDEYTRLVDAYTSLSP